MKYQVRAIVRRQRALWEIVFLAFMLMMVSGLATAQWANPQTEKERKEAEKRAKQQAKEQERQREREEKRAGDLNKAFLNASRKCQVEEVRDLLRRGANINERDKQGHSALFLAYPRGGDLDDYPRCESVLRELLGASLAVDDTQGELAGFVLIWALENNRSEQVASMLSKGVTANSRAGLNALKRALEAGNESMISLLLSHRAPMPRDALALAAGSGNAKLVNDLLDRGADILGNVELPRWRMTQSGGGIQTGYSDYGPGKDALMCAIAKGHVEIVRLLLARGAGRGANVLRIYEGGGFFKPSIEATALDLAAAMGQAEVVGLLLEKAQITQKLTTPLIVAALGGHADVVRVLLGRVSDKEKDLALMTLTAHIRGTWRLTGAEGYRKETRLLLLAQSYQTPMMQVMFVAAPEMAREALLKKAEAEGLLSTLQLLEAKPE